MSKEAPSRRRARPAEESDSDSESATAFPDGGQNQGIVSLLADARVRVPADKMDDPPYIYIVKLSITKSCGTKPATGTAFLVPSDHDKHCFFVTAAHNLCCANPGQKHDNCRKKFASEVIVTGARGGESLGKVTKAVGGDPPPPHQHWFDVDQHWFAVNPEYLKKINDLTRYEVDMGVIALLRSRIPRRFFNRGAFKVVDDPDPTSLPGEPKVSGFPLELNPGTLNTEKLLSHTMCEHYGKVVRQKRLLNYKIDTSPGQSGSPVWLQSKTSSGASVDEWVAIGVHCRDRTKDKYGAAKKQPERYNQGVVLRQADLPMLFEGFYRRP